MSSGDLSSLHIRPMDGAFRHHRASTENPNTRRRHRRTIDTPYRVADGKLYPHHASTIVQIPPLPVDTSQSRNQWRDGYFKLTGCRWVDPSTCRITTNNSGDAVPGSSWPTGGSRRSVTAGWCGGSAFSKNDLPRPIPSSTEEAHSSLELSSGATGKLITRHRRLDRPPA